MRSFILGCVASFCLLSMALAQVETEDSYKGINWQPHFEKALKQAKKENRPIMVAFILRGETANESICGQHFLDKKIIALSRKFVCLLAYAEYVSGDNKGNTETSEAYVQSFSHRISRKQLKTLEYAARSEYMESGQVSAPQFLFVHPNGETILLRHIWLLSASELKKKMHKALHYFDKSHALPGELAAESRSELDEIRTLLADADGNNMMKRRASLSRVAVKEHPDVVNFLIKQTSKDVDQSKRLEAIRAMGQEGQVKYLPRLHQLLRKERGFQIRTNIAQAIGDIGLVESVTPILQVLKKEKKKQLRSILIQTVMTCGGGNKEVSKALSKVLRSGGDLDKITILYRIADGAWDDTYSKALLKCLKSTNAQVRAAAYFAVGSHNRSDLLKRVKSRLSSEKNMARNACAWSLKQMGENIKFETENPSNDINMLLPTASY